MMDKESYEFVLHVVHHLKQHSSYIDGCLTLVLSNEINELSELQKSLLVSAQDKISDIRKLEDEMYKFLSAFPKKVKN